GSQVRFRYQITQHVRDSELLRSFGEYFGGSCGNYYSYSPNRRSADFVVKNFSDITDKVIPFFHNYPLVGAKKLDYHDFCKVVESMRSKAHLTKDGLDVTP
ncbi:LAGLIDADG endonuclease-domain-containing protein, partial [Sphaerosporella brunnea]